MTRILTRILRSLLLLVLILNLFHAWSSAVTLLSSKDSITQNLFGICKITQKNSPEPVILPDSHDDDQWVYTEITPTTEETLQYKSIPASYSKVHPYLAAGMVRQTPQAEVWASRQDTSWQLHEDHPRNNKSQCLKYIRQVVEAPLPLHEPMKTTVNMYVLSAKNVFIHENGIMASQCGYFQPLDGCETRFKFLGRRWWNSCLTQLKTKRVEWNSLFQFSTENTPQSSIQTMKGTCLTNATVPWKYAEKVFVINALWDHNYHHLLIDSLTRLVRFLPFLHQHPEVKIHIRFSEQYLKREVYHTTGRYLRKIFFPLLKISPDRLIAGPLMASQAFLPRAIRCNYPLANALEIR